MNHKIRLLLVDDSLVFREALARGLSHDPSIELLPTASNAYSAMEKINQNKPDIIVCDIEMPGINGIEWIERYIKPMQIPVILLSSRNDLMERALKAGAAAFIPKPRAASSEEVKLFMIDLLKLIIRLGHQAISTKKSLSTSSNVSKEARQKVICIGASTGGTEAIFTVLQGLPKNCPPIVVTQHIPEVFSKMFAERLNEALPHQVIEAKQGDLLLPGSILIAPGNKHMSIKNQHGTLSVDCRFGPKRNGHCPSVDILFESAARALGKHAIGVILTGMGKDGASGLLQMKQQGAFTIGQDEKSSVVYGMPKAAYDIGAVSKRVPLNQISNEILMHI